MWHVLDTVQFKHYNNKIRNLLKANLKMKQGWIILSLSLNWNVNCWLLHYTHILTFSSYIEHLAHRRKIELEDKAKVVAIVWGAKFVQLLAALAVLPRRFGRTGWIRPFYFK